MTSDASGRMLSGDSLLRALNQEKIFRAGSWEARRIKGAGYELRLAGDWVACPKPGSSKELQIVTPDDGKPIPEVVLAPGDTAVVATVEKFCLDFDISCSIGPKFRWAAEGLQLLHGAVAHPGYGLERDQEGRWVRKSDERLYMVVVNIGPRDITLVAGKPIAYVQLFSVERVIPENEIDNFGLVTLADRFIYGQTERVRFYRTMEDLKDESAVIGTRLNVVEALVSRSNSAIELVVVFGVFLVTVTLLGVVYSSLTGAVASVPQQASNAQLGLLWALSLGFGVLVSGAAISVVWGVFKVLQGPKRDKKR